jgi:2-desacetyl-2-hydroxyethyl bacteriochlorophyllide A dehydrogenase
MVSIKSKTGNPTLVLTGSRQLEVQDYPIPTPSPGEVLVRTICSLISTGTEMNLYSGQSQPGTVWAEMSDYPRLTGYSNIGEVIAVGEGVSQSWLGLRVHNHGKHQAYTLADASKICPVPDHVDSEEGTFTTLAKVVMNGLRRGGVTWGESIAVVGLGLLGQLAVGLCSFLGARPIFAVELSDYRLNLLPSQPCIVGMQGQLSSLKERICQLNDGRLVDVVLEMTGNPSIIPDQPLLLRPQGRLVIISSPRGASLFDFHDLCNRQSFTIIGAHGFSHPPPGDNNNPWSSARHGALFLNLLSAGEIKVKQLISHRFSFQDAPEAYRLLDNNRQEAMGVILKW